MNSETPSALADRLRQCAQLAGSGDELARKTAIPRRTLETYLSGETEPKPSRLFAIAGAAGVRPEWLLTGEPPMTRGTDGIAVPTGGAPPIATVGLLEERFTLLPRYDVRAAAGDGALVHSEQIVDFLAFQTDWLRRVIGVEPRHLALISAVGDSMVPTIKDGDLLLVDLAPELRDGLIYALADDGMIVIKRVQRPGDGTVRLLSDNPTYPPRELSRQDAAALRVVGRVVWHGGLI